MGGNEVILCENEKIVSDQTEVCNIFNKYFVNVAKDIGNRAVDRWASGDPIRDSCVTIHGSNHDSQVNKKNEESC